MVATPSVNYEYLKNFSKLIKKYVDLGYKFIIVVGGGKIAREYIEIAKKFKSNENFCDKIGILATRLNAMVLISSLGNYAHEDVITSTKNLKFDKRVKVLGGTVPGQTTDSVAAEAAKVSGADLLIFATDVNGIYDKDPRVHPDAKLLEKLTYEDLLKYAIKKHEAGVKGVIDLKAAEIIKRYKIKTIFLNGRDLNNIERALNGKNVGTIII